MKVPAIKRYRTDWLSKKPKLKKGSKKHKIFGVNYSKAELAGIGVGTAGALGLYGATGGFQRDQNVRIEMSKISKERRAGKKFTSKEIDARLKKAKQSKREFTWV